MVLKCWTGMIKLPLFVAPTTQPELHKMLILSNRCFPTFNQLNLNSNNIKPSILTNLT